MLSQWNEYPPHIKYLLEDLETSDSVISTLQKYTPMLATDSILSEIFHSLGYLDSCDAFTRVPSRFEVIGSLQNYYETSQTDFYDFSNDQWDVSRGIKEEFLKTFYENKLQDLSENFDLGLNPFESDENCLNSLWNTPPPDKKINESISTEENTPNKNSRGLKLLTHKVKHIIYTKGFFSYKEVSDELVNELEITEGLDRNKEEKNVLRRVYDALNVLIASEVVVQKGKKYVWRHTASDINLIIKKKILKQKLKNKGKREVLKEAAEKFLMVKQLLNRNQEHKDEEVIPFPFIIVATEEHPENSVKMESNTAHTEIKMKFAKDIKLFGDLEVLQRLNLTKDLQILPEEVQILLKNSLKA